MKQAWAVKLGGTKDLRLLPRLERLRYLELWLVKGLTDIASAEPRIVRLHLEVLSWSQTVRKAIERACRAASFRRSPAQRMYRDTVLISLLPTEDEIFAGFRSTARKNIRALLRSPATRSASAREPPARAK